MSILRDLGITLPKGTKLERDTAALLPSSPPPSNKRSAKFVATELVKRTGSQSAAAKAAGVANVVIYRALNESVSEELFDKLTKALALVVKPGKLYVGQVKTVSPSPPTTPSPSPIEGLLAWVAEGKRHGYFQQREELLKKL